MALITANEFTRIEKNRNSIHKPTSATYTSFEENGNKFFQIDTYGSEERIMKEKISQTVQLNKKMAEKLVEVLRKEFNIN
jgi:hypothetical protein